MKISADKFILECSYEELWTIGRALINQITNSHDLKTHWSKFDVETWLKGNLIYADLVDEIMISLGRPEYYKTAMNNAEEKLKELIEERMREHVEKKVG